MMRIRTLIIKQSHFYPIVVPLFAVLILLWGVNSVLAQDGGDDQLQLGAQVYAENCAVCHGLDGEGRVGATLAKDFPSIRPDLAARATIAEGVPGTTMPAWSLENGGPLSEAEIDAVVNFILSWQTGGAPRITPGPTATAHPGISPIPDVEGDPFVGAALYDYNCALCHGEQGRGRVGSNLSQTWGSIRPDLAIRNTIANGVPGSAMPAWSQQAGGPLTEAEIDDIVAYVQTLEVVPVAASPTPDTTSSSRLVGWGGVILTLAIFVLVVLGILGVQRQRSS